MKVRIQNSVIGDSKTVTFTHGNREWVYIMDPELAKCLETRLNCMWQFKHGILQDDIELIAMFKHAEDRDACLLAIHPTPRKRLEAFSCEGK